MQVRLFLFVPIHKQRTFFLLKATSGYQGSAWRDNKELCEKISLLNKEKFDSIAENKKAEANRSPLFLFCAQDWIRTSTPFPAPPPQGGLSTNFNTWA
jgi:hypothetical protein